MPCSLAFVVCTQDGKVVIQFSMLNKFFIVDLRFEFGFGLISYPKACDGTFMIKKVEKKIGICCHSNLVGFILIIST